MNREILFRGKRVDNGEWVYGFYFEQGNGCDLVLSYISLGLLGSVHVDKNTVGQFIGLTDKNGKKIFEGDIIRWKHWNGKFHECPVTYNAEWNWFYVWERGGEGWGVNKHLSEDIEAIGNIYDEAALEKKEDSDA